MMKKQDTAIEARFVEAKGLFRLALDERVITDRDGGEPIWQVVNGLTILGFDPARVLVRFSNGAQQIWGAAGAPLTWCEAD